MHIFEGMSKAHYSAFNLYAESIWQPEKLFTAIM